MEEVEAIELLRIRLLCCHVRDHPHNELQEGEPVVEVLPLHIDCVGADYWLS